MSPENFSERIQELTEIERKLRTWQMCYTGTLKLTHQHRLRASYDEIEYILIDLEAQETANEQARRRSVEQAAADKAEEELHARGVLTETPPPTYGVKGAPE